MKLEISLVVIINLLLLYTCIMYKSSRQTSKNSNDNGVCKDLIVGKLKHM